MGLNEILDLPTRRRLLFAMLKLRGIAPRWRVKYTHFEEFDLNEMEIRRALVDLTFEEGWISVGDEYLGKLGMTKKGDVGVITGVWCPKQDEIETYLPLYVVFEREARESHFHHSLTYDTHTHFHHSLTYNHS